jgi:DNA-binding MarR family transcriptional regulator
MDQLEMVLALFSGQYDDPANVPLHHCRLFLAVGRRGQCRYRDLEEELDLANSSVSRTVNALASVHRNGKPGLGLITTTPDQEEGRRFIISLTTKGRLLYKQIQQLTRHDDSKDSKRLDR